MNMPDIVTLVETSLSAHCPCTFIKVYEPAVAKAYLDRLEFCLYA